LFYYGNVGVTGLSILNNDHFKELQDEDYDLSNEDVLVGDDHPSAITQQDYFNTNTATAGAEPAGVVTTRAASLAFFSGGTNRLMWRATSMNYLCRDLEEMKDTTRPPDHIRQDVSRSPGGDSSIFLNNCMGCHAGMDPLVGAYAYYDHTLDDNDEPSGAMLWQSNSSMFPGANIDDPSDTTDTNGVTQKYLINSSNFEYGYITVDNHWTNHWRQGPNSALGWGWSGRHGVPGPNQKAEGYGAASLGYEVTASRAFAVCQVEKVFKHVCLRDPVDTGDSTTESGEGGVVDTIATAFATNQLNNTVYNMKTVFAKVAAQCMGE
jgi:hypothetical protein